MNIMNYSLKTASTALSKEQKSQNSPKAKRIVIGVDVHLKSYQAARKIDNGVIGVVAKFRSQTELLLHIEKQLKAAEEVVVVYEAGPLGYVLYRELEAHGIRCYVCASESTQQKSKRRKNNQIDARSLTANLFITSMAMSEPYNWREYQPQPRSKPEPEVANTINWSKNASGWGLKATLCY